MEKGLLIGQFRDEKKEGFGGALSLISFSSLLPFPFPLLLLLLSFFSFSPSVKAR